MMCRGVFNIYIFFLQCRPIINNLLNGAFYQINRIISQYYTFFRFIIREIMFYLAFT